MRHQNVIKRTRFCEQLSWKDLNLSPIRQLIKLAKSEDLRGIALNRKLTQYGDVTTRALVGSQSGKAAIVARESMVVCGLPLIQHILDIYGKDCRFTPLQKDGDRVEAGTPLGYLKGPARTLLTAERIILNFTQRLSGITSHTNRYVEALGKTSTRLLDTRKTTPGYRNLEKYAVSCGGGWNHRIGLYDRVLIKDNHLAASKATKGESLAIAVKTTRQNNPGLLIEVEVDHLEQIPPILSAKADIILLDNFSLPQLKKALHLISGKTATEASGGITLKTIRKLSNIGLDYISCGALIHQSTWVDIGLDWV